MSRNVIFNECNNRVTFKRIRFNFPPATHSAWTV